MFSLSFSENGGARQMAESLEYARHDGTGEDNEEDNTKRQMKSQRVYTAVKSRVIGRDWATAYFEAVRACY